MSDKKDKIKYAFEFEDGNRYFHTVSLDEKSMRFVDDIEHSPSEWTKLSNCQCDNCPLSTDDHEYCPVAKNLDHLIACTKDKISYTKAKVAVKTKQRTYCKDTTMQEGLFSLFGVIMASSGCPVLDFLRPMVRFHLPFATLEETIFRSVCTYLLREYLETRHIKGKKFDLELKGLIEKYSEVEIVNSGIMKRIQAEVKGDADKNAIVALNIFAQMFSCEFSNDFDSLAKYFEDIEDIPKAS